MPYKFLRHINGTIASKYGNNCTWNISEWKEIKGYPCLCNWGFHCSTYALDALLHVEYTEGSLFAEVEGAGEVDHGLDKDAWERMRLLNVWNWDKSASIQLAIFVAEYVLPRYKRYKPGDRRVEQAITAAKEALTHLSTVSREDIFLIYHLASEAGREAYDSGHLVAANVAWTACDTLSCVISEDDVSAAREAAITVKSAIKVILYTRKRSEKEREEAKQRFYSTVEQWIVTDLLETLQPFETA